MENELSQEFPDDATLDKATLTKWVSLVICGHPNDKGSKLVSAITAELISSAGEDKEPGEYLNALDNLIDDLRGLRDALDENVEPNGW